MCRGYRLEYISINAHFTQSQGLLAELLKILSYMNIHTLKNVICNKTDQRFVFNELSFSYDKSHTKLGKIPTLSTVYFSDII